MLKKLRGNNTKGFTLIELMIVIAIIGILAAIAIPNFIAYRDKSFCSRAESDAQTIAAKVADYFSVPTNTTITPDQITMVTNNGWTFTDNTASAGTITIQVTDNSGRCPSEYRDQMTATLNPGGYWSGQSYIKVMDQ